MEQLGKGQAPTAPYKQFVLIGQKRNLSQAQAVLDEAIGESR